MYKYNLDILDMCSETEKEAIIMFCKEINASNADVFVVMAHKAVHLFHILIDQMYINESIKNKIIISNEALDFDASYLVGKKVAVIDDIIISGTALSTTVNKLISLGVLACDITVIAIAYNKKYFTMNFDYMGESVLKCNKELEDEVCISLSYNISKIFAYFGVISDIDFPLYKPIKLDESKISLLFNEFFWETSIISNLEHCKGKIDTIVLFPKDTVLKVLWDRLGVNLENNAHLKIRINISNYPSGKKEAYFFPMCLFDEIYTCEILEIYNRFKPNISNMDILGNIAQMRYLQYYISHQLLLVFQDITSFGDCFQPTIDSIKQLFGLIDTDKFLLSINRVNSFFTTYNTKHVEDIKNDSILKKYCKRNISNQATFYQNGRIQNNYYVNRVMLEPFLWWYDTYEMPVRVSLKNNPKHYIFDSDDNVLSTNRLISGFSFNKLKYILKEQLSGYDYESTISLFIDRAIDEGIIVPTLHHNIEKDYFCRAYRHGEDLPFALEDECRLLLFVKDLSNMIPNIKYLDSNEKTTGISEVSFEKMVVLFYQMGLKSGELFNRFLGFDNTKLLKSFLSLHGKIGGFIDKKDIGKVHFYSEKDENGNEYITWLTSWLETNNFIKRITKTKDEGDYYAILSNNIEEYLQKTLRGCIDKQISVEIDSIASMISKWYISSVKVGKQKEFKEDAIALTSCSEPCVYASAIATEIHYFSKFWTIQVKSALSKYSEQDSIYSLLTLKDYDRKHTLNIVQGLNSGQNKVKWYRSDRAEQVVQKVANLLDENGKKIWYSYWDYVQPTSIFTIKNDIGKYTEQAIGYLYFYSVCYDCIISDEFWIKGKKPNSYINYMELYKMQCERTDLLKPTLFSIFDRVIGMQTLSQRIKLMDDLIMNVIANSEDTVSNIEKLVDSKDSNYSARYKSALILEIKAFDVSQVKKAFMTIWNSQTYSDKVQTNIIPFPARDTNSNSVRYGVFYGISGRKKGDLIENNQKVLINYYNAICNELNAKVYYIKSIFVPHTPPGRMFKHNIQENVLLHTEEFDKKICDTLEKYYKSDTKQQMVMALTENVYPSIFEDLKAIDWNNTSEVDIETLKEHYGQIFVFYNDYIKPDNIDQKEIPYSLVKVENAGISGTGFLLRTAKQVLCISCNHVFQNDTEKCTFSAISEYAAEFRFLIEPKNDIIKCDYKNTSLLTAVDEVAVFEPKWEGKIPFEIRSILSIEDLIKDIKKFEGSDCICCGYSEGENQRWSNPFNLVGKTKKGYYQTKIGKGSGETCEGYSGGLVVLKSDQRCIIGIHEGRSEDDCGRIIPCLAIINKIARW